MNCVNCGAPLPPTSNICTFCHTLNDTDLRAIGVSRPAGSPSERLCPRCDLPLTSVNIGETKPIVIERCAQCLGLFFDPGELEAVLDDSVRHVYGIDYQRMTELNERERQAGGHDEEVRYLKCPQCRELMMRRNFGARSGVVVDTCKACGVWLDAGELGHLLRWVKAGGRTLDHQRKDQERREAEKKAAAKRREAEMMPYGGTMEGRASADFRIDGCLLRGALRILCDFL